MVMKGEAGDNYFICFRKDTEPQQEGGAESMAQKLDDVALPVWSPLEDDQASERTLRTAGGICFPPPARGPAVRARLQQEGLAHLPQRTATPSPMASGDTIHSHLRLPCSTKGNGEDFSRSKETKG